MNCPTPCVCGEIVELSDMRPIKGNVPLGGNLVCENCVCPCCDGEGECGHCLGGCCCECGRPCQLCDGDDKCGECNGQGFVVRERQAE